MTLTNKQRVFIQEYLKDFNATQAALRSGYSEKTSRSIGPENLSKPEIKEAIESEIAARSMGKDEVLTRLADIARGDIADLMVLNAMGFELELTVKDKDGKFINNPKTKLIKKIKQRVTTRMSKTAEGEDTETIDTEIELYSALDALQLLGKYHGMFTDKTESTVTLEVKDTSDVISKLLPETSQD